MSGSLATGWLKIDSSSLVNDAENDTWTKIILMYYIDVINTNELTVASLSAVLLVRSI